MLSYHDVDMDLVFNVFTIVEDVLRCPQKFAVADEEEDCVPFCLAWTLYRLRFSSLPMELLTDELSSEIAKSLDLDRFWNDCSDHSDWADLCE
jgi:hypothetical protein